MSGREHRRTVRLKLGQPLKVVLGSMGSEVRYELGTRDISNNGFFLDFDKPGRFPFTPSSIMEVWMELGEEQTVFFNGKMARVVMPDEEEATRSGPGIAIRIVQINQADEDLLVSYINKVTAEQEASQPKAS